MPQVHLIASSADAFHVTRDKIWNAPDDQSALVSAHLIIEVLLHKYIQLKLINPEGLESVGLRFYQALHLARCFRKHLNKEEWLWNTLEHLNQIRNRLSHDIDVLDLDLRIDDMYEAAGPHIDIHAPGTDPKEREENKLKYFLSILCIVVYNIHDTKKEI